ncbi:hypothetical protein D9615_002299 [Tricholomella constricta]|uniref:PinX1-related protein 1 n=1 Tax=Tricholomella constricta TaxID=117010 RepID=A0A8H5HMB4_9AGAR|nr:hypothetical protein D9615_002299 [Tricholomella constricta]
MGLSGRKVKQRIPADPRNLAWADDAAKFGSNYLSKFGWDSSKGLGVNGEGRTSHIKVSHKLDMLGIGAAHQMDPDSIAWKQNEDFENLLKRLNEASAQENTMVSDTFTEIKGESEGGECESEKQEKKRKRKKDREGTSDEKAKKKRKKNAEDAASKEVEQVVKSVKEEMKVEAPPVQPSKPFVPRNRAHRARAIASKSIASKSSASIAEILGIAPTPSTSAAISGSGTPVGKLTPLDDGTTTLEKLTTSTKSVADYFKEKLLAKVSMSGSGTPVMLGTDTKMEDSYAAPRGGLGSSRLKSGTIDESIDSQSQRIGLSKYSSLMSSTFLSATTSLSPPFDPTPEKPPEITPPTTDEPGRKQKQKKKRSTEDDGSGEDNLRGENKKKEKTGKQEKKKKQRKGMESPVHTEEGLEKALSKEERRRLRKEKKSRRNS